MTSTVRYKRKTPPTHHGALFRCEVCGWEYQPPLPTISVAHRCGTPRQSRILRAVAG